MMTRLMTKSVSQTARRVDRWHWRPAAVLVAATAVLLGVTAFVPAARAQLRAKPEALAIRSIQIRGTIYGSFDYAFEGTGAWVGYALVSLGDRPAKVATFVDRNTSFGERPNGAIYGTETITLQFTDGSGTFEIRARFEGTPGATPGLYNLHEVGAIANGTKDYAGASGYVVVNGPFLFPDPSVTAGAPPWIATIHGAVAGIEVR